MTKNSRIWIILLSFCLLLCSSLVNAQNKRAKSVLVLNSYHPGFAWSDGIMEGIKSKLESSRQDLKIDIEYMDTKKTHDSKHYDNLYKLYRHKFNKRNYDLIITSDDNAFYFMLKYHDELFPHKPVVFCGLNYLDKPLEDKLSRLSWITGSVEMYNIRKNLDLILRLHPAVKQIVVISDSTLSSKKCKQKIQEAAPSIPASIKFRYLKEDAYMEDILEQLKVLPTNSIVLLMSFFKDMEGTFYPPEVGGKIISENSPVPIYSAWDFYLGHGITGGLITSGKAQGEMAAKISLRVMNGENASDIPISKEPANYYMFDYDQLKRFDIKLSGLPKGSIVINRPHSLYLDHRGLFWGIVTSIGGLSLIILVLVINIIRRIRAEEALRESEEKYRHVVENANEGIIVVKDRLRVFVNPKAIKIFGYSAKELMSRPFNQFIHLDDREMVIRRHKKMLKGVEYANVCPYRIIQKNGGVRWVESNAIKIMWENRPATLDFFSDISDRKQAEEALRENEERHRRLYEQYKKEGEVYHSLINSSADAIVIYDMEGRAKYISPAFTQFFGWTLEEVEGKRIPFVPESEKENTTRIISDLIRDGTPCRGFETKRYTNESRLLDVSISASRYDDHEGKPAGMLATIRDISGRKALEAQLLQAHKMEAIGTLAGGIAHDFNNILQTISGYSQILMIQMGPDDSSYSKLEMIQKSVMRASDLTKQLLVFGRKVKITLRPVDINHELKETSNLLERTIPKMINIKLHLAKGLKIVNADPVQLEQVLMNLGVNARDAMTEGGKLTFKTENVAFDKEYCRTHLGAKPGKYVLLTVSDTGHGMDKQILEHIFEPFFTTKELGKGTGLGLAMVYGIVKRHNGHVTCFSDPGLGTTFKIYFPVLELGGKTQKKEQEEEEEIPGGSETILLVDDEETSLDIGQYILEKYGYTTVKTESGEKALEVYKQSNKSIDLIILDLNMPGMGGEKCLQEILKLNTKAKIIVATGYPVGQQTRKRLITKAAAFLSKPFQLSDMLRQVRDVLDKA